MSFRPSWPYIFLLRRQTQRQQREDAWQWRRGRSKEVKETEAAAVAASLRLHWDINVDASASYHSVDDHREPVPHLVAATGSSRRADAVSEPEHPLLVAHLSVGKQQVCRDAGRSYRLDVRLPTATSTAWWTGTWRASPRTTARRLYVHRLLDAVICHCVISV